MATISLLGGLATLLLALLTIRSVVRFVRGTGGVIRLRWPYLTLCAIVAFFWLAPWERPFGRWSAEKVARKPGGLIIAWPYGARGIPVSERPRPFPWGAVFMAETGVHFSPPSSFRSHNAYEQGFYEVMEAKVKERFGDDIFLRVTKKTLDLKGEMPEPIRKLSREGAHFSGWTEGHFLFRDGTLWSRTLALRYDGELRRFEAEGSQIIAWDIVEGRLVIHSRSGSHDAYERFNIEQEQRIEIVKDRVPEWAAGLTPPEPG